MPNEPELQEEELTEEEKKSSKKSLIGWAIFFGAMAILMITCVVVIKVLG